jgi:hypothetical protein
MYIAFFTENQFTGKLARNQGGRTDANWIVGLDAEHFNFNQSKEIDSWFEFGFIIVPKKEPMKAINFFWENRNICEKWCWMQEGPANLYQDFPIETQLQFLGFLNEVDFIYCHNEQDVIYFKGIFPDKKVYTLPSLLIEDSIPAIPHENRSGSLISGNMCSWYGGMDSFIVAQFLGEQVFAPSMGRKLENEDGIVDLHHLPYMTWQQWFLELNKRKYGINLMPTFAAGSFSLACARLKIPCLGWGRNDDKSPEGCDAQRLLFPELTIPKGNMQEALRVAKHLKENKLFYDHVSEYAFKAYNEIYSEKIFITKLTKELKDEH